MPDNKNKDKTKLTYEQWAKKLEENPQINPQVVPDWFKYGELPARAQSKKLNPYMFQENISEGPLDIGLLGLGAKYNIPISDNFMLSPEGTLVGANVKYNNVPVDKNVSPAFKLSAKYNFKKGGQLDTYGNGGGLEGEETPAAEESEAVLLDKDATPSTLTEEQRKSLNIKEVQKMLKAAGLYEGKIDGIWGPNTQAGLDAWQEKNTGLFGNQLSPYLSPLNVAALQNDISGEDAPISQSSLSSNELDVLRGIVRGNLAKGKTNIEYADYRTHYDDEGNLLEEVKDLEEPQYFDVGSTDIRSTTKKVLDAASNPAYNLKSTLGQASIAVTPQGDTLVVDQYNFNNAAGDTTATFNDYLAAVEANPSLYNLFRSAGTVYGSPEGEGAQVLINTAQRKNGGWLDNYAEGGELEGTEQPTNMPVVEPAESIDAPLPTLPDNPIYIEALKTAIGNTESAGAAKTLGVSQYEVTNKAYQDFFNKKGHSSGTGKYQILKSHAKRIKEFGDLPKKLNRKEVMEEFRNNPQLQEDYMDNLIKTEYLPQTKLLDNIVEKYGREAAISAIHLNGYPQAKKLNKLVGEGRENEFKVKGGKGNLTTQEYMSRTQASLDKETEEAIINKTSQGLLPEVKNNVLSFSTPTEVGTYPGATLPVLTVQNDGGWLDKY